MLRPNTLLKAALAVALVTPPILKPLSDMGLGGMFLSGARAATYYVSPSGNDSNTGTSPAQAWQTITKVNQSNSSFAPGDVILFESGYEYRGGVVLSDRTGITLGTYPVNTSPATLKGSRSVLSTWVLDGNRYYTDLTNAPAFISHVYEDGQLMHVARFPNANAQDPESSFRRNSTGTGATIIDNGLPGGAGYWTGCWVVVRSANWQYEMREVLAHTEIGGEDALVLRDNYPLNTAMDLDAKDWGYYLVNKLDELDAAGEWYYDASIGRLYAKSLTAGQAPQNVEIVVEQHGLYLTNCNTITVEDLEFAHFAEAGIRPAGPASASQTITIRDCDFRDLMIGVRDLSALGLPGRLIERCTFQRCLLYGVRATWLDGTLQDCTFKDIGLWSGFNGLPQADGANLAVKGNEYGSYSAIYVQGDGVSIARNVIEGAGNNGINFSGSGAAAQNNYVSGALSLVNDGAAITFDYCDGCQVRDNIVSKSIGVLWGQATNTGNNEEKTTGIYFGNHEIVNTTVEGNTVSDCSTGILIDHAPGFQGNAVVNNTVFNCEASQILLQDLGEHGADPYQQQFDTEVSGNILYGLGSNQLCLAESQVKAASHSGSQPLVDFGNYALNYYFNPFNSIAVEQYIRYDVTGNPPLSNYIGIDDRVIPWSLNGWRTMAQHGDPTGVGHPLRLPGYRLDPGTPPVAVGFHTDECAAVFPWNATAGPFTGNGADGSYLSFANQDYLERWGAGLGSLTPIVTGSAISPPGTYRFQMRMRSANTDALQLGPIYDTQTNKMPLPHAHFALTPGWSEEDLILEIPEGYDMVTAFQNVQRAYGAISASDVDIDYVRVDRIALDPTYTEEIAANHILRYHADLPGTEADPQNTFGTGGSFELIGCWSDVYGNIHSGTVTLAPWESVVLYRLEDQYDIDVAQYNVQGNETWNTDKKVRGSVVISNGETLTIDDATISFADSRQDEEVLTNIVVESGGTLELINGAHLTTLPTCGANSMWDGVKNYGNVDPSAPQGMVRVHSGSRISNSLTGILGGEGDPLDPGYAGPIKNGLIDIRDAFFENNLHDVVLHGLPNGNFFLDYWDVPFFQNTTFSTTAHLNYDDLDPVAHVRVADHGQSILLGCTFANDLPTHTQSHRMGLGIQGLNANIAVWGTGPGSSVFRNLDHAIHNLASAGAPYTNVVLSEFIDNICAVYMKDVPGFAIRGNTIQMGRWDLGEGNYTNPHEFYWDETHRAVFSTGSNAFSIMDNILTRSQGNSTLLEGIVVGYTNADNEVVFRNSASDLDVAYVGEGECADQDDVNNKGLQFQCNVNIDNAVNIKSRAANGATSTQQESHTIRGRQGTPTFSASNEFDGAMHFEVATRATALTYIEYTHVSGDAPITYTIQDLGDLSADYLTPVLVTSSIGCPTGDPVWINGTGSTFTQVKPYITTSKYEYGNLRYQLEQLIDGGSTDETVQQITDAWPQDVWNLRDSLLSKSPYLSGSALRELVNNGNVPVAVKAEILIANPDATKADGFLEWAETEADYPIPGYLAEAIEDSWDTRTYRTTLEESIADKHTRLTQLVNKAIYLLQTDSVPADPDSLRWVWQQLRTNRARYAEAALLMGLGRHAEADSLVRAMPAEKDYKEPEEQERLRMLKYIEVLGTAAADSRNAYELTAIEVDSLEAMVSDHYDRPANWASNLICAVYGRCRAPYTGDPELPKANRSRQRADDSLLTSSSAPLYGVQPNPSSGVVVFNYKHDASTKVSGEIVVRDPAGRVVHRRRISGPEGQQVWEPRDLAPDVYMVQFLLGSEPVHTEKLIIQR